MGGRPTMIVGYMGSLRWVIAVTWKTGVGVLQRVVSGVVAKGPLHRLVAWDHVALDDHLGVGRHLQVHGFGPDQLHTLFPDEARHHQLVHVGRHRRGSSPDGRRVASQGHRHVYPLLAHFPTQPVVAGTHLVGLPVHGAGVAVKYLDAVHPQVSRPCDRVLGNYQGQGDIAAPVQRPALDDGIPGEVHLVAGVDHLLAGGASHDLGLEGCQLP